MPRKPVDQVTEHRITLGEKERQIAQAAMEAADKDRDLRLVLDVAQIAAMPLAIAAAGFFVYRGMNSWGTDRDKIAEWWNDLGTDLGKSPFRGGPGLAYDALVDLAQFVGPFLRTGRFGGQQ